MRLVRRTVYPLDVRSTSLSETISSSLFCVVLVLEVLVVEVVLLMNSDVGLALGESLVEGAGVDGQARGGLGMTGTFLLLLLLSLLPLLCLLLLDLLEDHSKDIHHGVPSG